MSNIKFIGASYKRIYKRLFCQLHLTVTKGQYQNIKIPLKSLVTGKPYVVRTDILLPSIKGTIAFADRKMTRDEISIAKEIKETMSLLQLAINDIEARCKQENKVVIPSDFATEKVYAVVAQLSEIQKSPMVNVDGTAKHKQEVYVDAYWADFVEKIKQGRILYNGRKYPCGYRYRS